MELKPKQSLEYLISARLEYEQTTGDRTDAEHRLWRAIARAEIEVGNLMGRIERDVDLRGVYNQLLCETEMGKGVLEQQTPARH